MKHKAAGGSSNRVNSNREEQRFDRDRRNVEQLMDMFPGVDYEVARIAWEQANGDMNLAINDLLALTDDTPGQLVDHIKESPVPAHLLESITSTPIDQLLEDEKFAMALQAALEDEDYEYEDEGPNIFEKFWDRMKRPRSAKDDESGKGSGTQNLKRKWASLSANAQDRIRKMYAKLQSKDQREHQALLGSDEDMRQHQDDDEVPSMREVQRPSSGRAASSKQKPPVNNDRTVVLNPAPGEQTAIITQSDDNLYSEWNPAHGEYGYTSSGSANTARVEPRAGRTQSSNNSGSNSNSRPQSSRTIS